MALIPALRTQRHHCESGVSLGYIVSVRQATATQRDAVSKQKRMEGIQLEIRFSRERSVASRGPLRVPRISMCLKKEERPRPRPAFTTRVASVPSLLVPRGLSSQTPCEKAALLLNPTLSRLSEHSTTLLLIHSGNLFRFLEINRGALHTPLPVWKLGVASST